MTYREAFRQAVDKLGSAGIESVESESRLLMETVCRSDLGFYLLHADEEMPAEQKEQFDELVEARCGRVPLQHLVGEQFFMGLSFLVNDRVLIPRQDTEILAEEAIRVLNGEPGHPRVLDLCTGSGCLAVSIQSFCPESEVTGSDLSEEALGTASQNALRNGVKVQWIRSDLFEAIEGSFDLIVSNPPYIPTNVLDTLMPEVREHEPRLALDGGADGLDFYRRILPACGPHLRPGGTLLLEIGSDQGEAVADLLDRHGFGDLRILPDLTGMDRVVSGRMGVINDV